jgi:hypothetical protein
MAIRSFKEIIRTVRYQDLSRTAYRRIRKTYKESVDTGTRAHCQILADTLDAIRFEIEDAQATKKRTENQGATYV